MIPDPSLAPMASPGEAGAVGVWVALSTLLVSAGVEPSLALAIAGFGGSVSPYIIKAWIRHRDTRAG